MQQQMTTFYWLQLSGDERARLAQMFGLKRTGGAVIHNLDGKTEIVSDGYTEKDLAEISIEKMQKLVKSKEKDFWTLFDEVYKVVEETLKQEAELERQKAALEADKAKA